MEPNRRLSTSNQGLSAARRSQGSLIVNLRFKDLFLSTNMAGLNPENLLKERCATPILFALIFENLSLKNDFFSRRKLLLLKLFLQKFLALSASVQISRHSQMRAAARHSHAQKIHSLGNRQREAPTNQIQFREIAFFAQSSKRGFTFFLICFFHATSSPKFPERLCHADAQRRACWR